MPVPSDHDGKRGGYTQFLLDQTCPRENRGLRVLVVESGF